MNRRVFTKLAGLGTLGLMTKNMKNNENFYHSNINWENLGKGLDFSRIDIYKEDRVIETIVSLKVNPENYRLNVFNGFSKNNLELHDINGWQKKTCALAMINGNQYMAEPYGYPCALIISDGKHIGPEYNEYSRGMLVSEPKDLSLKLKKADLLDFEYDNFNSSSTNYTQGIQHWPILLDRNGKIKVKDSGIPASRTVVAKTNSDEIIFFKTEGSYFSLYNFGEFLKESNMRIDKGLNIHTAMNLDGGPTSEMIIKTKKLEYSIGNPRIPCTIGIFKRD